MANTRLPVDVAQAIVGAVLTHANRASLILENAPFRLRLAQRVYQGEAKLRDGENPGIDDDGIIRSVCVVERG